MLLEGRVALRAWQPSLLAYCLVLLASLHTWAADRTYYSTGNNVSIPSGAGRVALATKTQASALAITAVVSAPSLVSVGVLGPLATVRLALSGEAPAGYRAGVLVSTENAGLLSARALEAVTLRTYLRGVAQEGQPVDASVLQLALLAAKGQPRQLEFTTTKSFDEVEITFDPGLLSVSVLSTITTNILYAYGVAPGVPKPVTGYLSQFASPAASQYSTANGAGLPISLCANNLVGDPLLAVDNDLTNYAYFNTTAGVGCTSILQVQLNGTVPASGYRAGFVVGSSGLLDVGLLNGLRLRTYLGGVPQEEAAAGSLLQAQLLADGLAFVHFPTTKEYDAVSIERMATAALVNNLRLYFGFGLAEAAFTTSPIETSFPLSDGRFTNSQGGVLCVGCATNVTTPTSGDPYLKLSQAILAGGTNQVHFELTGPGLAGYRAGVVLGYNTLLDVDALKDIVLTTYDASGEVLETATAAALLTLQVLPDNRREISFRTTRGFAQVGISINSTLGLLTDVNVYSAFADDNGLLQVLAPAAGPLPVVLTSFTVSRAPGAPAATVRWATASERHSDRFVVERTTNPQAGFVAIGQVAAAGTSPSTHQYSLCDATAPTQVTSYYRLRQIDNDGRESLSPVVALAAGQAGSSFTLYPNPAPAGPVWLSLAAPAAVGTTVVMYSPGGQVVRRQEVRTAAEQPRLALSTDGLPAGVYQVVLRDAGGQALGAQRLVIAD